MLWKSVVGKLWMTIIGLVSLVLIILTLLLAQFFDDHYTEQQTDELHTVAANIATIFGTYDDVNLAMNSTRELVDISQTTLTVIGPFSFQGWTYSADEHLPAIQQNVFIENEQLQDVLEGETIVVQDEFPVQVDDEQKNMDVIMVAVPIMGDREANGAVFLYQTSDVINETVQAAQQIVLYSAGIGILFTTVFAFFLTTRITQPLRQMKAAAKKMQDGDFDSRISIRQTDEIGDLSATFNYMAKDLKDSIQALSHEKEHLSSILKSMIDGVVTVDVNGEIVTMNPPAEKMLNTWKYEENGDARSELLPNRFLDLFNLVVETQEEQTQTVSAQGRYWTIVIAPLYDDKKIRGVVAVIRDETEEKRTDKLREDFVANVSHELRTPLSMLQGYSEALVDDVGVSKEEQQELAQIIHEESLRMGRLVNELLDLARMEAGHNQLDKVNTDLSAVLQRTARKFTNLAREQHIRLKENIPCAEHQYEVDPDRLEQVFINLIDNAIRHTPEQGTVYIHLEEHVQGAQIEIKDTGDGIPEEDLPFVFERFYKADKARTRGKTGTGLGLSIAKQLVEAHNGHIEAHSKMGEGTTFSIWLPKSNGSKK